MSWGVLLQGGQCWITTIHTVSMCLASASISSSWILRSKQMFGQAILTQSCTLLHLWRFISIFLFSFPISAILSLSRWFLDRLASVAGKCGFPISTSVSFCFLLGGSCDSSTSPWADWNINGCHSSFWICVTWGITLPLVLLNLWPHWSITRWLFRFLASTLHVRENTWQLHYLSLIWSRSNDRSSSMSETYPNWLSRQWSR